MTGIQMMERVQGVSAQEWVIIAGIVVSLYLLSAKFDNYIETQADNDPFGGYNAWFVVVGVSYTAVGVLVILALMLGWWTAATSVLSMFAVFAIALIPMLRGDMRRAAKARQRAFEEALEAARKSKDADDAYSS